MLDKEFVVGWKHDCDHREGALFASFDPYRISGQYWPLYRTFFSERVRQISAVCQKLPIQQLQRRE